MAGLWSHTFPVTRGNQHILLHYASLPIENVKSQDREVDSELLNLSCVSVTFRSFCGASPKFAAKALRTAAASTRYIFIYIECESLTPRITNSSTFIGLLRVIVTQIFAEEISYQLRLNFLFCYFTSGLTAFQSLEVRLQNTPEHLLEL